MNEKVKAAYLDKRVFIAELHKQTERVIDEANYPGIKMIAEERGVACHYKGLSFVIPYSYFQNIVFDGIAECFELKENKKK